MNGYVSDEMLKYGFIKKSENVYTDGEVIVEFDSQYWLIGNSDGDLLEQGTRTNTGRLFKYLDQIKG